MTGPEDVLAPSEVGMTEPQVTSGCWKVSVSIFLLIQEPLTLLPQHSGPTCLSNHRIVGTEEETLACPYKNQLVTRVFLVLPSCPTP